jgi:bifunctional non-homologous end joining protein LigD
MAELRTYNAKRDFSKTPEPRGAAAKSKGNQYVIQKHAATRLHYDLRLELDGVMLSWAVTKGPSLVPGEKRLAIHTEDHPIEYNKFEGTIPKGEYGGGTVMIWDRGRWFPEGDARKGMKKGHLDFRLEGEKLQGRWHLVRLKQRPGERQEAWLLIKSDDKAARGPKDPDILEERSESVVSGRSIDEIAAANDKQWHSNRPAKVNKIFAADPPKPAPAAKAGRTTTKAKSTTRGRAGKTKPLAKPKAKRKAKDEDLAGAAAAIPGARRAKIPEFVPPCLATLSSKAPNGPDWVHEIKFDGYRIQAGIDRGKISLKTRTGLDWTSKFPRIAEACVELASHRALIDGEVVSEKTNGISDFSGLQDDLKTGRHDRLAYYVFDLLYLDGYDLTGSPLSARKEALRKLLSTLSAETAIRRSEQFEEDGSLLLKHACGLGLEGIISKRRDAPFRSGRVGDWLKTKCTSSQELVVAGYEPSTAATRTIRSLVLSYYDNGEFRYAGRVGSGLSEKSEDDLVRRLKALQSDKPPFNKLPPEEKGRKVKWVKPRLVVEVDFRGWTGSGLLRQASFKGVREDKPPEQVVKEMPKPIAQKASPPITRARAPAKREAKPRAAMTSKSKGKKGPEFSGVTLTNPDRVYWPDVGLTKQGLAEYYTAIWDWMAPHFVDRPLSLVRCPEGALTECFFQKHASAGLNAKYLREIPEKGNQHFIAAKDLKGLMALVQAGTLEIHLWGTTADMIETCDRLVFDLDPGPEVEWSETIAGAREVRQRLAEMGLETFLKTTGGKGLHVVAPIEPTDWDTAKGFAHQISLDMARDTPDKYTANMAKKVRTKRIYVDYLRNGRGATAIAAYSTRARPGATVSMPISWNELGKLEAPNIYRALNLPQRLKRQRKDPWADIGRVKQRLPKAARTGK